jgi:hypothetical protein
MPGPKTRSGLSRDARRANGATDGHAINPRSGRPERQADPVLQGKAAPTVNVFMEEIRS